MRFCKRKSISSRAITHIAQKDTRTTQEQQDIVVSFFAELDSSIHFYEKRAIVNMDETPVYFDMVQSRTLSERGAKSVDLNTTGNDKMRFTVALTLLHLVLVYRNSFCFAILSRRQNVKTNQAWSQCNQAWLQVRHDRSCAHARPCQARAFSLLRGHQ